MKSAPTRKPARRRWIIAVAILIAWIAIAWRPAKFAWTFRESAMRGLTPAQVLDRCGDPTFASRKNPGDTRLPGEPVWMKMETATREQLLASEGFMFGYYGSLGDHYSVWFKQGRVDHVAKSSK